jgi:hypothetical protein
MRGERSFISAANATHAAQSDDDSEPMKPLVRRRTHRKRVRPRAPKKKTHQSESDVVEVNLDAPPARATKSYMPKRADSDSDPNAVDLIGGLIARQPKVPKKEACQSESDEVEVNSDAPPAQATKSFMPERANACQSESDEVEVNSDAPPARATKSFMPERANADTDSDAIEVFDGSTTRLQSTSHKRPVKEEEEDSDQLFKRRRHTQLTSTSKGAPGSPICISSSPEPPTRHYSPSSSSL